MLHLMILYQLGIDEAGLTQNMKAMTYQKLKNPGPNNVKLDQKIDLSLQLLNFPFKSMKMMQL